KKIHIANQANVRVYLDIDNSKLAAEDFRMKYEYEISLHQAVLADNASLKTQLDRLTLERSDLEMKIERMREELVYMKKNHQEEIAVMR
ncbi:hypothetical protein DKP78_20120, partial [Enterococcus faecium]